MTPAALAALHQLGFTTPRPWSAEEFAQLLEQSGVTLLTGPSAFALCRVVADEAELLTITVAPNERRKGHAKQLVAKVLETAHQAGAVSCFLEVAATNTPAQALYTSAGFRKVGLRRAYYQAPAGEAVDAVIMVCELPNPVQNA
ncbi:GNAT family N-acetyltransferase [Meridianimarinicoccus aquatilis]|uniref:GNAT family N-acetyltransferase n=1 Tax=Meridianimarinicoccus aquatilis TaxID=2552766 RepID=A0A4R6B5V0_9RHOB|nr:GNAT family N-acetyltransferase [Fluviibacterium aquatile]TDL91448.1 GNAT family N-acetyltransferase [Fluviibacterium aquatile]